ncbi:hypothetical protein GDO86_013613 [Hymenochirus boettgeri]|uniref:Uncharacterized protein n=1 Tax=Hymenochirus boettgeri TaxID=247094 RepID=A0A8T2IZ86_9PIPI|nr:hypothetical protein GDO86_013613 [Hymenochirus boettgeri]
MLVDWMVYLLILFTLYCCLIYRQATVSYNRMLVTSQGHTQVLLVMCTELSHSFPIELFLSCPQNESNPMFCFVMNGPSHPLSLCVTKLLG